MPPRLRSAMRQLQSALGWCPCGQRTTFRWHLQCLRPPSLPAPPPPRLLTLCQVLLCALTIPPPSPFLISTLSHMILSFTVSEDHKQE